MAVLARVVESTSAGVWILDNQLHTVWSNRAIDEILGTHPAPGTTPLPFLDDRGQETLRQHIRLRPRGLASSYHLEIHRPDGETRPVLVLGSPVMNEDGSWAGSFGIFIDFTQQLREQDRESRRDRLETLGAVVTRLNHKINNALMVIRGQAEIMLRRAGDAEAAKGPERIIEYVDIIYDEMQAISNLKDFEIEPYPGGHIMLRIPEADAASPEN
jgi:PAS domain S-box-containing protein